MISLRALVRDTLAASTAPAPADVAKEVLAQVDDADLRDALAQALPEYVRQAAIKYRQRRPDPAHTSSRRRPPAHSRNARIREAWRMERLHVGGGAWKLLPDCTYDDLMVAADERREHAARNTAAAARYEQLAQLLQRHSAATVGDLPAAALAATFEEAA